ncbi:MAG: HAMP domain-containing histidine kinase [Clostridia bacterium]|nr:HAMP domain-containing histidine kinase [Clostridia bacterium]
MSRNIDNLRDIVHDLKTPITSIKGFVELLLQSPQKPEVTKEFYNIILDESHKLLNMINEILYSCKNQDINNINNSQEYNLNIQIGKYVKELTPLARKKNIDININSNSSDIYVSIPEDKLSRLLTNIIENAIKYNREHGKVFIDINQEQDMVFVKIRDTGIGIPEEELDKIFNKYYRSSIVENDISFEGSGLGLAIAHDIVTDYNGTISVNSKLNEYTEFVISFPASQINQIQ